MDGLSVFALIILLVLLGATIGVWAALAIWPGRIAKDRNHSKAEAVAVCGYWGAITLGLLMPLAFIWAYTENNASKSEEAASQ